MAVVGVALLFLLFSGPASGGEVQPYDTRLLVGSFTPLSGMDGLPDRGRLGSTGFAVGGRFLAGIAPYCSLGGEIEWLAPRRHKFSNLTADSATGFDSLLLMGNLRVSPQEGMIRPYALGGVGIHHTSMQVKYTLKAPWTLGTQTLIDTSVIGLATLLEAGIDVSISERLALGVAGAWHYFPPTTYKTTDKAKLLFGSDFLGVDGPIYGLSIIASVAYQF